MSSFFHGYQGTFDREFRKEMVEFFKGDVLDKGL